jgi:serine/threonine protein kinase
MKLHDSQQRPIRLGNIIGQGGEACVYQVEGRSDTLAKIFQPAPRANYEAKLGWMIDHPPENPTRSLSHPSLAWPSEMVYEPSQRLAGYLMPFIRQAVPALEVFNPRRRAAVLPEFDLRYLYRVARNLSAAVAALHRSGYVIGDLNESNVLVNPSALVTLIDTDSFQVQERQNGRFTIHYCPVGKLEYTPPELLGRHLKEVTRLPEHDGYALAVLVFQLLMGGSHPFRAQWVGSGEPPPLEKRVGMGLFPYMVSRPGPVRPPNNAPTLNHLPPLIAGLFKACFIDGHHDPVCRPSSLDWRNALTEAEKELLQCPYGHYFAGHLRACPACPPPRSKAKPVRRSKPGSARPLPLTNPTERQPPAASSPAKATPAPVQIKPQVSTPLPPAGNPSPTVLLSQLLRWAFPSGALSRLPSLSGTAAPAASISRPVPSQPARPVAVPVQQPGWVTTWLRPRLAKSFLVGASTGALLGVLPGALLGLSGWSFSWVSTWVLLWVVGGVSAAAWRGWLPGNRLAKTVTRYIGWERLWRIAGTGAGAILGALLGMIFWWAIFPIFLGMFAGARLGVQVGRKIWLAGIPYGWERIGALTSALTMAAISGLLVYFLSASRVGVFAYQPVMELGNWLAAQEAHPLFMGTVTGALGGALGGVVAGFASDLAARLAGLLD